MLSELKFSIRQLAKSPGFTTVAVCTVALGIASATAIFSVANAVVFRPLPFRDESSLAWVWSTRPDRDRAFFSIPNFLDTKQAATTVADFAAITPLGVTLTGTGEPERVLGWTVTSNLFSLLGTPAALGRLPLASDDAPGASPVAVLGYGYWQRRFGGDPHLVGRVVTLNGVAHTVVGILPPAFSLPNGDTDIVVAQSLDADPRRTNRGLSFLRGIARLKPGVTFAQAQAELAEINTRLVRDFPDANSTVTAPRFVPLREETIGGYRGSLLLLLGAAGALLLIMSANLAGLLAARALGRQRDAALCAALGASPGRLLRGYLAEGFLLAVAGGTLGVIACWWGIDALLALAPADLPRANQVALDWPVLAVALGCTLLTGLGVGLGPALRLARTAPLDVLKSGSNATTARGFARNVLVATQVALCTLLLVGTGLLVRSLRRLLDAQPGFVSQGVLNAQVSVAATQYRNVEAAGVFADDYQRRLAELPGVTSASYTSVLPLTGLNTRYEFFRPEQPPAKPSDTLSAANRFVGANYFATVGIPLLAGRDFRSDELAGNRRVVIIDQALAQRHWPGEDPLGKAILIKDTFAPQPRDYVIVGIAGPTKNFSLEEVATPTLYIPFRQFPPANLAIILRQLQFVAKATNPNGVDALKEPARRELHTLDGNAAVALRSLDEVTAWARAPRIFNLRLLGFFSAAAVLLAALGLYAITAQAVTARTREIGIRMALGADRVRIAQHIFGAGARLTIGGILAGLVLAAALSPLLAKMLYQVRAFDPVTYGGVAALLVVVAGLATWLPTRRATRVDPIVALRSE